MYKVFVNDIPIILSTEKHIGNNYRSLPLKYARFNRIVKDMHKGKQLYLNLYHKNEDKLLKFLKKKLPVVIAGGGLVYNDKKEILFISRNKKWDLPKGKIEKNESIEDCALREVMEETGIKNLINKRLITKTYHIFKRNGRFKLKETHWFEMYSSYDGILTPQTKEGIKKVKWKDFKATQKALTKSYENIKLLFPDEYLSQHPEDGVS